MTRRRSPSKFGVVEGALLRDEAVSGEADMLSDAVETEEKMVDVITAGGEDLEPEHDDADDEVLGMAAGLAASVETEEKTLTVKYAGGDDFEPECLTTVPVEPVQ